MEEFFLAIGGLPLHPLAVHFAVALFPVALIALIAVISIAKLRDKYLAPAVVFVILTLPLVFVAQQSGEALSEVTYEPQPHSEYGEMLMPLALLTSAVAASFWLSLKKGLKTLISRLLGIITISLSVASIAMTFVVGHSGAEAVWGGRVPSSQEQIDSRPQGEALDTTLNVNGSGSGGISPSEVALHATAEDCWVVIDGSVYELDKYMTAHPGGKAVLTNLCGKDGTSAFSNQHAREALPKQELAKLYLGILSGATSTGSSDTSGAATIDPSGSMTFSSAQVSSHSTISDCWTVIDRSVYDLSSYANEHPGGASNIADLCGKDATSAFAGEHGFNGTPAAVLAAMVIGTLDGELSLPSTEIVYGDDEGEDSEDD